MQKYIFSHWFDIFEANGNQLSLPAILRSQEKWNFLEHAAWICFQHTEITETYIDVHCLNEPTVLSARYLILKEIQTSEWVLDGLQQGYFTMDFFSNKGIITIYLSTTGKRRKISMCDGN